MEDLEIKLDSEIEYPYKGSLTKYLEYSDLGTLEEVSLKLFNNLIYEIYKNNKKFL